MRLDQAAHTLAGLAQQAQAARHALGNMNPSQLGVILEGSPFADTWDTLLDVETWARVASAVLTIGSAGAA